MSNQTKLLDPQEEITALKASILSWKAAWFDMRDACGKNYWTGYNRGTKVKPGIDPILLERWKNRPPHNID
jgi:hypothetical protein